MPKRWPLVLMACAGALLPGRWGVAADPSSAKSPALRFEVTVAAGLLAQPTDGRVLVVLSRDKDTKDKKAQPRRSIGETGMNVPPVLGADAKAFRSGEAAV